MDLGYFDIGRDVLLIAIGLGSWFLTPKKLRKDNNFHFHPFIEVATLFVGIFITLAPILMVFAEGPSGPLGGLMELINTPTEYFWAAGALASFLDNAPTYLVFFNLAGGNAEQLMTTGAPILKAITVGSVFMGCNTYIGNAPNLLVLDVAKENGIKMPSFFRYMAWALACVGPVYLLLTVIFFPWW